MQPVEIDIVSLEPSQRAFQGAINILAPVSPSIRIARVTVEGELCRQYDSVAHGPFADELTQQLFTVASCIEVGCIDEVSTCFQITIENLARDIFFRTPAPFVPKGHRAQTELAHSQSGTSQRYVVIQIPAHVIGLPSFFCFLESVSCDGETACPALLLPTAAKRLVELHQ